MAITHEQQLSQVEQLLARNRMFRELHQAILNRLLRQIRQQYPQLTDNEFNSLFA